MPNAVIDAYKEQINQLFRRRDEAQYRLQAVSKTADEIRATIQSMDELLLSLQEFVHREADESQKSPVQAVLEHVSDSSPAPRKRATGNSKKEDVAKASRLFIEQANRPLARSELFPLLVEQGFRIAGTNPEMVLSTMLWRAGEKAGVVRLRSGGYWLIEQDWPEARYYPSLQKLVEESGVMDDLLGD